MNARALTALAVAGLLAGAAVAGPVAAAPKKKPKPKPITRTYEASAFPFDPSPAATDAGNCQPTIPGAAHLTEFRVPAAGTLEIWMSNFQGDWDLGLRNKAGKNLNDSAQDVTDTNVSRPEHLKQKFKAATVVTIAACNFLGGPTATVKYTFTYL